MAAEFDSNHVKNIVLIGHAGSGKTTLAECMLFEAGLISQRGQVGAGNTVSDYHELEIERGNSVFSTLLHSRWRGYKINIIDTPGYDDFVGEVVSALRVADTAIMLLNAANGVEVGTDLYWQYANQFSTPLIFAVNQLDHEQADYDRAVQQAKDLVGNKLVIFQYPLQQGAGFHEIIDVLRMTMYKFSDTGGKPEKLPIPEAEMSKANQLHRDLVEAVAANDEKLMALYFEKGELTEDELKEGLHQAMIKQELTPLFCLSAERNMGSGRLMGFIDHVCPSAAEMPAQTTRDGKQLLCSPQGKTCIFVYKTVNEPHIGELSFFKVFSGTIKAGMDLENENTHNSEKINQLFVVEGNKRVQVHELSAGDIGATLKLRNTHVNNTLHEKGYPVELAPIFFPPANMRVAISPQNPGEDEKISSILHQLLEEDPTISIEISPELKQTILHCQGELHLAMIKWKLEHAGKLSIRFSPPGIPYRETIRKSADAGYRHKKQSGGAGQFAEVQLRIEPWLPDMPAPEGLTVRNQEVHPLPWGGQMVYCNCIVGGAIDNRFHPSIVKGVMEKMQEGPLTGSYVRDIRVSVYDGKMHAVDSNDISFKIAGLQAFRAAFKEADPQLLEPIYDVEVTCPDELTGAVIGDIQIRRGIVDGMDAEQRFTRIHAKIPLAELHDFSASLRSITQGRARFSMQPFSYKPVPGELQNKLAGQYASSQHLAEA